MLKKQIQEDLDELPQLLKAEQVKHILNQGRRQTYRWMKKARLNNGQKVAIKLNDHAIRVLKWALIQWLVEQSKDNRGN